MTNELQVYIFEIFKIFLSNFKKMGCDICKYNDVLEYSKKNSNDPL